MRSPNIKRVKWMDSRTEAKNKKKEVENSEETSEEVSKKRNNEKYIELFSHNCPIN